MVCAVNGRTPSPAGDVVVAARSAYFYLPFLPKLGVVPDLGSTWFVPWRVGPARAMGLALLDEKLDAQRAAPWGLIGAALPDEMLPLEAHRIARKREALPAHAVREARGLRPVRATHARRVAALRKRTPALLRRRPGIHGGGRLAGQAGTGVSGTLRRTRHDRY